MASTAVLNKAIARSTAHVVVASANNPSATNYYCSMLMIAWRTIGLLHGLCHITMVPQGQLLLPIQDHIMSTVTSHCLYSFDSG